MSVDSKPPITRAQLDSLGELTADEQLLAQLTVAWSRDPDATMVRGRLIECHIARVLGDVEFAPLAVHPWDLRTSEGVQLEIKTGKRSFSLKASKRHDAAVWIFVPTEAWAPERATYYVGPNVFVEAARRKSGQLTLAELRRRLRATDAAGLRGAIDEAAAGGGVRQPPHHEPRLAEPIDHVPGDPELTRWRRAARRHQTQWRATNEWPPGTQRTAKGAERLIGSRIEHIEARRCGHNFLTDEIRAAVEHRLAHKQPRQTLNSRRLYCDLLSSMPMCFNLFGSLWSDPMGAAGATHAWFPDLCPPGAKVDVGFEWSPARGDDRFLGDRTAFDAVFTITAPDSSQPTAIIGIEAKYHEAPIIERHRPDEVMRDRYREVTERAGLFVSDTWAEAVWGTGLEQIWRDHLLALAIAQHPEWPDTVKYVLVAPSGNPAWKRLADEYQSLLSSEAAGTFAYRTVEQLVDSAEAVLPHAGKFRRRYLEVDLSGE